jgi:ATP-dependent protease ClpP protease subunit
MTAPRQSFWITGEIDYQTVRRFHELKRRPTQVFVASPGGDPSAAFALLDALHHGIPHPKTNLIALGEVTSAAALIVICAPKRHRFAYPSTLFGLHEPFWLGGRNEKRDDPAVAHANHIGLTMTKKLWYQWLDRACNRYAWRALLEGRSMWYADVEKALKSGMIDGILWG